MFNPAVDRCSIHGPSVVVVEEMTCDYYEKGRPHRQKLRKVVTPKESNLRDSRGSTS
jgi:hypothetical protein